MSRDESPESLREHPSGGRPSTTSDRQDTSSGPPEDRDGDSAAAGEPGAEATANARRYDSGRIRSAVSSMATWSVWLLLIAAARALAEHRSQTEPLSEATGDEALLRPSMMAHLARPFEAFVDSAAAGSLGAAFFDAFYAEQGPNPWGFTSRWYEQRKRTVTLACLPREQFRSGLEIGYSLGCSPQSWLRAATCCSRSTSPPQQ